jgi:hypothetical protein
MHEMVETARNSVKRRSQVGNELVIQRAIPTMLLSPKGHKQDFRVFVCCSPLDRHDAFVYRKIGLRSAPQKWDKDNMDRQVQCTHGGHIMPVGGMDDWPHYGNVFPRICDAVRAITNILRPRWVASRREDQGALLTVLYGMDFICDANHWPHLLEVNQVPRMTYHDPNVQSWVDGMGTEFLRQVILPVLNGQPLEGDTLWFPVSGQADPSEVIESAA